MGKCYIYVVGNVYHHFNGPLNVILAQRQADAEFGENGQLFVEVAATQQKSPLLQGFSALVREKGKEVRL